MKLLKIMIMLTMVLVPFRSASAAEKTIDHYLPMDIDEDYWAYEEVDDFINADIIDGYVDEELYMYVNPDNKITRAQFVKILVNSLGLSSSGSGKSFSDVAVKDWHYDYVRTASALGIISGKKDGTFGPNENITRDQMTKMIVLAFENTVDFPEKVPQAFTDIKPDYWAYEFVGKAAANGIVKGYDNIFKPRSFATRAQAIVMIHRALKQEKSHIPAEEVITAFLKEHILKENQLVENHDFAQLADLYKKNGTGYYKVSGVEAGSAAFPMEEGDELEIQIDDEKLNLEVIEASDRFITAEQTGMSGKFIYTSGEFNFDFTMKMDGAYKLKKDPVSGEWKIYNFIPYFDEEEQY
ncbi:S-layer homology domain-containing protein [Bacillus infantis]|uniref:S-layer homology domain-containing protein n=1 Tax=Bacillus infantis TaxID=324767 RepID=UPI003CF122F5